MNNEQSFFAGIVKRLRGTSPIPNRRLVSLTPEQLIEKESVIGASIFGETPENEHRKFFKELKDEKHKNSHNRWHYYQQINNSPHSVILCYEVHPKGVLRITNKSNESDISYEFISGQELTDFKLATKMYHDLVIHQMYGYNISADKKAA